MLISNASINCVGFVQEAGQGPGVVQGQGRGGQGQGVCPEVAAGAGVVAGATRTASLGHDQSHPWDQSQGRYLDLLLTKITTMEIDHRI